VLRFMLLASLVCFAFSCGVNQLYWYYSTEELSACEMRCNSTHMTDCEPCDRSLAKYVAHQCVICINSTIGYRIEELSVN